MDPRVWASMYKPTPEVAFDDSGDKRYQYPWMYDEEKPTRDDLFNAMDQGKVISFSGDEGIPNIWKNEEGFYRGQLLQWRSITQDRIFGNAEEAIDWFLNLVDCL